MKQKKESKREPVINIWLPLSVNLKSCEGTIRDGFLKMHTPALLSKRYGRYAYVDEKMSNIDVFREKGIPIEYERDFKLSLIDEIHIVYCKVKKADQKEFEETVRREHERRMKESETYKHIIELLGSIEDAEKNRIEGEHR